MILEAKEGDRVDLLVWAECGRDKTVVERVLDANPGLARIMYDLPIGYQFNVPDALLAPPAKPAMKRLW